MKTSTKHIQKVMAYLKDKDDAISRAQYNTLLNRMNESQVFSTYMSSLPEEERNEDVYYAARDAARFLAGKLPLSAMIPDSDEDDENDDDNEIIPVKRKDLENILKRLERLEIRMGLRTRKKTGGMKDMAEAPEDLICQAEAIKYIGCGKSTLKRWVQDSLMPAYTDGRRVFYSKEEIKKSRVYNDYKANKNTPWKK